MIGSSSIAEWFSAAGTILSTIAAFYFQWKAQNANKPNLIVLFSIDLQEEYEGCAKEICTISATSINHCPCFIDEIGFTTHRKKPHTTLLTFDKSERISERGMSFKMSDDLDSLAEKIANSTDTKPDRVIFFVKTSLETFYSSGKTKDEIKITENIRSRF